MAYHVTHTTYRLSMTNGETHDFGDLRDALEWALERHGCHSSYECDDKRVLLYVDDDARDADDSGASAWGAIDVVVEEEELEETSMSYLPPNPPSHPSASKTMRVYRLVYKNERGWISIDVVAPSAERARVLGDVYAQRALRVVQAENRLHFAAISPNEDAYEFGASEGVYLVERRVKA